MHVTSNICTCFKHTSTASEHRDERGGSYSMCAVICNLYEHKVVRIYNCLVNPISSKITSGLKTKQNIAATTKTKQKKNQIKSNEFHKIKTKRLFAAY